MGALPCEFPETARQRDILGHDMGVIISMLRGVNVGGHNKIKMDALRELYESLKLWDAQSYVQSGNVIFRSDERDISRLTKRIEEGIEPNKLLVTFLASDPGEEAREKVRQIKCDPEELRIEGRELYIYFPNGMGRSKLSLARLEKTLKTSGTGRNWNSVTKMLEMAEKLETSE